MQRRHVYRAPPQYKAPQLYSRPTPRRFWIQALYDPATQQSVTLTEPGGGWNVQSIPYGQTPAIVTGDQLIGPLYTPDGYPVTIGTDGIVSYAAGGVQTRQILVFDLYDVSTSALRGSAPFAINNIAPAANDPTLYVLAEDVAMTPVDLSTQFSDPEGDAYTISALSGLAGTPVALSTLVPGLTIAGATMSGTPTTAGVTTVYLRATDAYNATSDGYITIVVGLRTVPDVVGLSPEDALTELLAEYLSAIVLPLEPGAIVISQTPAAGLLVAAFSEVTLYTRIPVPDVMGETLADAIIAIEAADLAYEIDYRRTASYDPGLVIDQDPASTEYLDSGDVVTITISRLYPVSLVTTQRRRSVN